MEIIYSKWGGSDLHHSGAAFPWKFQVRDCRTEPGKPRDPALLFQWYLWSSGHLIKWASWLGEMVRTEQSTEDVNTENISHNLESQVTRSQPAFVVFLPLCLGEDTELLYPSLSEFPTTSFFLFIAKLEWTNVVILPFPDEKIASL